MNRGIITRYYDDKAFGFIGDITGENFFFHVNDQATAFRPKRWMKVKFESVPDKKNGKYDKAVGIVPAD